MKKIIGLIILGLIAFYGLWPAYSGYQIFNALQSNDAALLERKVDFDSVRVSLRPAVTEEVGRQFDQAGKDSGLGSLLGGDLKKQLLPQLVDSALKTLVTPANVLRIYAEGGDMKSSVEKIMREQMAKAGAGAATGGAGGGLPGGISLPGGLGQLGDLAGKMGVDPGKLAGAAAAAGAASAKPAETAPAAAAPKTASTAKSAVGFANIKRFGLNGPLGYEVGVAKDAAAGKPDVTAGMSFSGFDWKLTKIVPNL
jgi:hypothetical protein